MVLKKISLFVLLIGCGWSAEAQHANLFLSGRLDYQQLHNSEVSDIWGYADTAGNEYALTGVNRGGLSIADITNPASPAEVFYAPGPFSRWRDIKTWNQHAYMVTEGGGGLLIVDMSSLPGAITGADVSTYNFCSGGFFTNTAHNLYIDENGICYIFGAGCGNGGAIMLDLNPEPMAPVEVGLFDTWSIHDGVARGDTLYAAHILNGFFSIVDVSNKQDPVILGIQNTPVNFTHNVWISDNGNFLFATDEVSGSWVTTYDISDPGDIRETDRIQSNPGSGVIPHNTHFINRYLVTSYYRDGITIHDVSNPSNLIQVGNYDTSPFSGNGFNGCWGVYPWLPSGNIIASDIEGGLFILTPSYVRGCYLEGTVTGTNTGNPINAVDVELMNTSVNSVTNITGSYATGTATAGTYNVVFSKPGYISDTAFHVVLTHGQTTVVNRQLKTLSPFLLTGHVSEKNTAAGIANAQLLFRNDDLSHTTTTDGAGNFTVDGCIAETYEYVVGIWGHVTDCGFVTVNDQNAALTFELEKGYYDDFSLDFNWEVTGNAADGIWERAEPNGTLFGNIPSNPDHDATTDCMGKAYVTGNDGGSAENDDVDAARTILTSPVFDIAHMANPVIGYERWFFNAGGQMPPNDTLTVTLTNGTDMVVADQVLPGSTFSQGGWQPFTFHVNAFMPPADGMQVIFHTSDWQNEGAHLVEAALDNFRIAEDVPHTEPEPVVNLTVYPNPFQEEVNFLWPAETGPPGQLVVFDLVGKVVLRQTVQMAAGEARLQYALPTGSYLAQILTENGTSATVKLIRY